MRYERSRILVRFSVLEVSYGHHRQFALLVAFIQDFF